MSETKPLILITNDDGVEAEGIRRLTVALRELGNIIVFAPDGARSGMSCAITSIEPIRYKKLAEEEGLTIYSCSGTPTDCVKLAINEVLPQKPDLVVSGINHGGNQALSVHYSGTMGAAFEGCVFGVPSLGVSLQGYVQGADFSESCRFGCEIAKSTLQNGLPYGTYLNLNVPNVPKVKGISIARQTEGRWINEYRREVDENGDIKYWLTGDYQPYGKPNPDNDVVLLDDGYATLVPCKLDVTDYGFMEDLKKWI